MSLCRALKFEYESLQTLTREFVSACAKGKSEGNFQHLSPQELRTLQIKKQQLETARDALKEKLSIIIHVKDAVNPYREALLASGIPDIETSPLSTEKRDVTINLRETIKQQQEYYKSMGLTAWAENIATLSFFHLTPEKRRTIEQEIKDGAIPIVMPDKETQLDTTVEQFKTSFKPTWINEGEEQEVNDAQLEWDHFINLINTKTIISEPKHGEKHSVPNHPYLSFIKPTQRPDERTTDKTVKKQQDEFIAINAERATNHQQLAHILTPHEYGALQIIHSRLVKEILPNQPNALNPIDTDTYTRFINLPVSGGCVPGAVWDPGDRRLRFVRVDAGYPFAVSGFRLAVRVEI